MKLKIKHRVENFLMKDNKFLQLAPVLRVTTVHNLKHDYAELSS